MQLNTAAPVSAEAPEEEFSAERATKTVEAMSGDGGPHQVGSAQLRGVRAKLSSQISALGLQPILEPSNLTTQWIPSGKTIDLNPKELQSPLVTSSFTNILVRIPGSGASSEAVLVSGHSDSVPTGPGTSDDASQAAAMVETMRALKTAPPLKHDVIFLFTDGEEITMRGPRDFVAHSPLAKNVEYILNFEYRGTTGKALFFEGNSVNGDLINVYRKVESAPLASSMFFFAYQQLENNTDFSVLRSLGAPGLALAPIGNNVRSHTPTDNLENFSPGALQYSGDLMLGLVRDLADQESLESAEGEELTWFNVGPVLLSYSTVVAYVLILVGVLIWIAAVVLVSRRQRRPEQPGSAGARASIVRGFATTLLAVALSIVTAELLLGLIYLVRWDTRAFIGFGVINDTDPYRGQLYMVTIALAAATITVALLFRARQGHGVAPLQLGALALWGLLSLVTLLVAPPVAYLFTIPFVLLSLAALVRTPVPTALATAVDLLVGFVFVVFIFPIGALIYQGLSVSAAALVCLLVAISVCVLLPVLDPIAEWLGQRFTVAMAVSAAVMLVIGLATPLVNANHQQPNSLVYAIDADAGTSQWLSNDAEPDGWTKEVLGTDPQKVPPPESLLSYSRYGLNAELLSNLAGTTPTVRAPKLTVTSDTTTDDMRVVKFTIPSQRDALNLWYTMSTDGQLQELKIDGDALKVAPDDSWSVVGQGVPRDGYDVELTLTTGAPLEVLVTDQINEFPIDKALGLPPRPDSTMSWWPRGKQPDATIVTKSFTIS